MDTKIQSVDKHHSFHQWPLSYNQLAQCPLVGDGQKMWELRPLIGQLKLTTHEYTGEL